MCIGNLCNIADMENGFHEPGSADDESVVSSDLLTFAARLVRVVGRQVSGDSPAALRLLSQLDELGASTITDLAKADRTSQPTISAAVRGLEEDGLVARGAHPEDARSTLLTLTDRGRTVLAAARRRYGDVLDGLIAERGVDRAEVGRAIAVLRSLTDPPHPTSEPRNT